MRVFSIPGKVEVDWDAEARAIIDTWQSYYVTLDQFATAVMHKGLTHARRNGGRAWIVDSSRATHVFPQEIQAFIEMAVFPAFARSGIRWFITIPPVAALTKLSVKTYTSKLGPAGIQLVQVEDVAAARDWLLRQYVRSTGP